MRIPIVSNIVDKGKQKLRLGKARKEALDMNFWHFPFTTEEKQEYLKLVPVGLWADSYTQRLYYTDPKTFSSLVKSKERLAELL